jgi:hypothetical protein
MGNRAKAPLIWRHQSPSTEQVAQRAVFASSGSNSSLARAPRWGLADNMQQAAGGSGPASRMPETSSNRKRSDRKRHNNRHEGGTRTATRDHPATRCLPDAGAVRRDRASTRGGRAGSKGRPKSNRPARGRSARPQFSGFQRLPSGASFDLPLNPLWRWKMEGGLWGLHLPTPRSSGKPLEVAGRQQP